MAYPIGCYRTYPACMLLAVLLNGGKSWQVGSFLQCVRQDEKERMNQDATVEDQKKRKKLLDERSGIETSKRAGARCRIKMEPNVAVCGSMVGSALGFPREERWCSDGLPHWMLPNLPCMHAAGSRKLHLSPVVVL